MEESSPTRKGDRTNWGRWGDADEVGSLNYLTAGQVLRGVSSVRQGLVFTLGTPLCSPSGDLMAPGRASNLRFTLVDSSHFLTGRQRPWGNGGKWADDAVFMYTHGSTHVDALGHFWQGDFTYNGKHESTTNGGMSVNSILPIAERGIVGRGVLIDIARDRGVEHLEAGEGIDLADILRAAERQGIVIERHDILLVRTGWMGFVQTVPSAHDRTGDAFSEPGLRYSDELVDWFHDMEIPLLGTDNFTNECWTVRDDPKTLALHVRLMSRLGVIFAEINALDELGASCAMDKQYDFLYVASPLKIEQGTGAPVNPVAVK